MNKNPLWLALALALSLTGCTTGYVPPEDAYWLASSNATQEQIWGPFHDLAGTTWNAPNQHQVTYRWIRPNAVLGEEFRNPTTGALVGTNAIMPGKAPGTLVYTSLIFEWDAKVDGTSSIVFTQNNAFSNMPFRISRSANGSLVREDVTLSGGVVARVDRSSTFVPNGQNISVVASSQLVETSIAPTPTVKAGVRRLSFDEKVTAEINEQTLSSWGVKYHLYALPARKGEDVVVVTECNTRQNSDCWYLNTVSDDAVFFGWSDKTSSPKGSAYQFTPSRDNETIKVANTRGDYDLTYSIYVVRGKEAEQVWSRYKVSAMAHKRAEAHREAELERVSAESSSNNAATFNAIITGLSQGLAEGAADYQASQNNQAALLNNIAYTAQAAQAQQAYSDEGDDESYQAAESEDSSGVEAQQDAEVAASIAKTQQLMRGSGADPAMLAQLESIQQEIQQRQAKRKQQAGTNKILPSKIQLSTATNSITPESNLPAPAAESNNMAQGKVRLCNRPGDEGPAHWPTCPQNRAEEAEARRLASRTGSRDESEVGYGGSAGSKQTSPGSSGDGSKVQPGQASTSDDEAYAWCTQNKEGFRCWGPMGKMGTVKTLRSALGTAGCGKGEGDTPMVGETTYFECNIKKDKTGFHSPVPENPPSRW